MESMHSAFYFGRRRIVARGFGPVLLAALVLPACNGEFRTELARMDEDPVFRGARPATPPSQFFVAGASWDGRALAVFNGEALEPQGWLFFDVHARRFFARTELLPELGAGWTSQCMLLVGMRESSSFMAGLRGLSSDRPGTFMRYGVYRGNARAGAAVRLFRAGDRDREPLFGRGAMFYPNAAYDRIAGVVQNTADLSTTIPWELIIRDGQGAVLRTIRGVEFQAGNPAPLEMRIACWLSDGRTLLAFDLQAVNSGFGHGWPAVGSLYLIDTSGARPVRRHAVLAAFEAMRQAGRFGAGAGPPCAIGPLNLLDGERGIRLIATFSAADHPTSPAADRSSLWDLDLRTGALSHVADLPEPIHNLAPFQSPSGRWILTQAEPTPTTTVTGRTKIVALGPDRPPRVLPFDVLFDGIGRIDPFRGQVVLRGLAFLDDETLAYSKGYEIWRYDLRTGGSERLWAP